MLNKAMLIGNVGEDPRYKKFDNGGEVVQFTLATTRRGYTLKNGTQVPEKTTWHNVVLSNGLAKVAKDYVKKGTKLYVEGSIETRSYEDKQGVTRYITEIYGSNMELLSSKQNQGQAAAPVQASNDEPLPF